MARVTSIPSSGRCRHRYCSSWEQAFDPGPRVAMGAYRDRICPILSSSAFKKKIIYIYTHTHTHTHTYPSKSSGTIQIYKAAEDFSNSVMLTIFFKGITPADVLPPLFQGWYASIKSCTKETTTDFSFSLAWQLSSACWQQVSFYFEQKTQCCNIPLLIVLQH